MIFEKRVKMLWAICLMALNSLAQPKATVTHYSTADGMSHVAITSFMKDREGFMWLSTWDGINRFDGTRFISYKSFPGDKSPLKSDRIDAIVEGDNDHLWLKAYDSQIFNFTKATGQLFPLSSVFPAKDRQRLKFLKILAANVHELWLQSTTEGILYFPDVYRWPAPYVRFKSGAAPEYNLPSNKISFFYRDQNGQYWVGTDKGLACIKKNEKNVYRVDPKCLIEGPGFTDIAEDGRNLYAATGDGKLYLRNKISGITSNSEIANDHLNKLLLSHINRVLYISSASGALYQFDLQNLESKIVAKSAEGACALFEDSKGAVWIEPETKGILRYDPKRRKLSTYHQQTDVNSKYSTDHYFVFEDRDGYVWVSMKRGGFGYYDQKKDSIAYFFNDPHDAHRKFSNNVLNLFYDPSGVLWLTTDERGLEKLTFQANDFHHFQPENPGWFKSENDIRGLAVDHKNRLWAGTKNNKLYLIVNGKTISKLFVNEPPDGLGQVYTIMPQPDGTVWLGTKNNGLFKAEPVDKNETSFRLTHFSHLPNDNRSISSNEIYTVITDLKGRVWVGSYDGGIDLMIPDGTTFRFIHQNELLPALHGELFHKIRKLTLDGAGNIWAATTDGLLVIKADLNRAQFSAKTYSKVPGDPTSLGNNDIQYIYKDNSDIMWLGTSGGGLSRATGSDPLKNISFRAYTTHDGLFNDYIVSICGDQNGALWLASQDGLTRYDPNSGLFRNYDGADGIPRTVFSESSCVAVNTGELVFGTMDGLLSFNPEQLTDHRIVGQIVFTDLQVNNGDLTQLSDSSALMHQVNGLESLVLKHNQSTISFDYAVLDYRSTGKQNYSYRLTGFDNTWHSSRGLQRATYTNFPPGNYKFEIKCLSTGLYSNIPYKSLQITILPPPWLTWWAYIGYLIFFTGILFAIRKTALTMLRLRQRVAIEQKLAELKTTFFTNISHELRTPLTLIINPISAILETENLSQKGKSYITIIQKNASRMVRFINQLLDLRKAQSGNAVMNYQVIELNGFIKDICQYFNDIAEEKNISLNIKANADKVFCQIDADKIDIVIYNILANAFKFSPPSKNIVIGILPDNDQQQVTIAISDEGGGVPENNLEELFKLFYEGDQQQQKGTGIGLALSKEMVELHHGAIWATNNNNGGLTVSIRLKLHHIGNPGVETGGIVNGPIADFDANINERCETDQAEPAGQLVLLVEDNADMRTFLSHEIGERYRVATAENGAEGLRIARQSMPDLIISDIMMPEMDGIQMLEQLKNDIATSHIPVILLSARQSIESQIEGLHYGADYYIAKPFNNNFLMASIDNIVARRKKFFETILSGRQMHDIKPSDIVITSHDEEFLQKIMKIVEEGMEDPDFNIDHVAGKMNMSRSPFYKKLKSLTDLAPVEFIRDMRLKRAKQYLDAGETVISEVAFKVGFNNVKYFSTCFKNLYKKSPTDYLHEIHAKTHF